jgi:putative hydrolase of HD superfamily
MDVRQLIDIMNIVEKLKSITRHSWTSTGRRESVAEHCWRLTLLAYFVKDEFPEADTNRVLLMCLLHDIGEAFTGDIPAFLKTEAHETAESQEIGRFLGSLPEPYQTELTALFAEMTALQTPESKIARALDKLEAVLQHNEADISTWLPLEYDLNQTYGAEDVMFSDYMTRLKQALNQDAIRKIEEERKTENA